MCLIHDMYQSAIMGEQAFRAGVSRRGSACAKPVGTGPGGDLSALLERVAQVSTRPRYAFMLLTLIAEVAAPDGSAGPSVRLEAGGQGQDQALIPLRDWLCDALTPMGQRDPRRLALAERVRAELTRAGKLPADPQAAAAAIEAELRDRVRASGKTNLSRAVSELVGAGLLRRHYQGYAVDHHNRGAQRQAVYTLIGLSRTLIAGRQDRAGEGDSATPQARHRHLAVLEGRAHSAPCLAEQKAPATCGAVPSPAPAPARSTAAPRQQPRHLQGEFAFTA